MNYRDQLHPWCIIRLLPKAQRITIARFRQRNAAEEHLKVLRRLMPSAIFVILFESPQPSSKPFSSSEIDPQNPCRSQLKMDNQPER
ncbi:MAG: hypothetical protein ACTS2F_03215 [Thainema sp.]